MKKVNFSVSVFTGLVGLSVQLTSFAEDSGLWDPSYSLKIAAVDALYNELEEPSEGSYCDTGLEGRLYCNYDFRNLDCREDDSAEPVAFSCSGFDEGRREYVDFSPETSQTLYRYITSAFNVNDVGVNEGPAVIQVNNFGCRVIGDNLNSLCFMDYEGGGFWELGEEAAAASSYLSLLGNAQTVGDSFYGYANYVECMRTHEDPQSGQPPTYRCHSDTGDAAAESASAEVDHYLDGDQAKELFGILRAQGAPFDTRLGVDSVTAVRLECQSKDQRNEGYSCLVQFYDSN